MMTQDLVRARGETDRGSEGQAEAYGAVPNVTEHEVEEKTVEAIVKEAMHEFEEEKGDWAKSRG